VGHAGPAGLLFALIPVLVAAGGPPAPPGDPARALEDPHARCDHCHVAESVQQDAENDRSGKPDADCCLACHREIAGGREPIANGSRHLNAIVDCLSCHVPHPDGTRYRLRVDEESARVSDAALDPSTLLCLDCHEAFLQTEPQHGGNYTLHPVGITVPRMVEGAPGAPELPLADIHGTADPEDDIIACTTCHFQHESPNPDLLRWREEKMVAACTLCHWNGELPAVEDLVALGR